MNSEVTFYDTNEQALTRRDSYAPMTTAGTTASGTAEAVRAMAEVKAIAVMAKDFPRDPIRSYDNILKACQRKGLAERAVYEYARGGTSISGPSIRLAEVIANEWGNILYGFKELESDSERTVAQAFAWNLETNVRVSRDVTIPHYRHTKKGKTKLTDPRDIYELVANQMQRRVRACILEIVPGDVVEDAVAECTKTLQSHADTSPANVAKMLKAFLDFGVSKSAIETFIQRKIEAITAGNVVRLQTIFHSLRDGIAKPSDFFELEPDKPAKKTLSEVVQKKLPAVKKGTFDTYMQRVNDAYDLLGLDEIRVELAEAPDGLTDEDLQTLDVALAEKEQILIESRKEAK